MSTAAQRLLRICIATIIIGAPLSPALAARGAPAFIPAGAVADAPAGFVEMCARDSEACSPPPAPLTAPPCDDWSRSIGLPVVVGALARAAAPHGCALPLGDAATAAIRSDAKHADRGAAAERARAYDAALPSTELKLVRAVNRAVNRSIRAKTDLAIYGVAEYWTRPATDGGAGDCEDFALEKRARLIAAGFPPDKLFLAVVYRSGVGLHTVLVARLAKGDVVLDNLSARLRQWNDSRYVWLRVQTPGQMWEWRTIA